MRCSITKISVHATLDAFKIIPEGRKCFHKLTEKGRRGNSAFHNENPMRVQESCGAERRVTAKMSPGSPEHSAFRRSSKRYK